MFISRQKAVLTAALCLVTGLLPSNAKADISFIIDETHLADTLHTRLYSSPRLPSLSEIQLAAVCFVTDMSECEAMILILVTVALMKALFMLLVLMAINSAARNVLMALIIPNAFLFVRRVMCLVKRLIMVLAKFAAANMPLAIVPLAAKAMTQPRFPKVISKTAKPASIAMVSRNTKSNLIPVTAFKTAVL